jgi:cystathionine gamma-synthase
MTPGDGFETLAIHAGQEPDPLTGAVVPPIYQVSTYKQDGVGGLRGGRAAGASGDGASGDGAESWVHGYEYSRTANPTRTALEECLLWKPGQGRSPSPLGWQLKTACCAPSARPATM